MINLATALPLKLELVNFSVSMLLMEVLKCWYVEEFPKISIKMKNFKIFYKAQTATRPKEIIQPPPPTR